MCVVCAESDRGLPNSLWKEIYRSIEKLQRPSQSYFCSNNFNIETWVHDHLADTENVTMTDSEVPENSVFTWQCTQTWQGHLWKHWFHSYVFVKESLAHEVTCTNHQEIAKLDVKDNMHAFKWMAIPFLRSWIMSNFFWGTFYLSCL